MQPPKDGDYQKLLSEVIKKQIVILGPDITLTKARNVAGLTIADDGTVTQITGNPAEITQKLIEQFMELSGLIVKKTMEPLLANFPDGIIQEPHIQTPPIIASPQPPPAEPTPQPPQTPAEPVQENQTNQNNGTNPVT